MPSDRANRIRELFDQVVEMPADQRLQHVQARCEDDPAIADEVLALIATLDSKSTPLDVDPTRWFQETTRADGLAGVGAAHNAEASEETATNLAGIVLGDFRIIALLGRGGMSTVYEAEQLSLGRRVALKVLHAWSAGRGARRRFVDEAATLAQLKHPGIAHVISAGTHELEVSTEPGGLADRVLSDAKSLPWIAIELVEGARTIVDACRGKSESHVLQLFALVADAVHYGHQQGFIHRDLKPANILVNALGQPKVIDFGIARVVGPAKSASVTHADELLGSPRYMSPEQCDARSGPVDTRSDVYALGVVLYEALTGSTPHDAPDGSIAALTRAICEQPPWDPRSLNRALGRDAAQVVLKAIARVPTDRYQSAAEFAADLRRVITREPIAARRRSIAYTSMLLIRRRPVITALSIAAALGLLAGMVGITLGLTRERAARREADRAAWLANLTAADSSIRLYDGGAAMRRLDAIQPNLRGWEWRYLSALADTSLDNWRLTDRPAGAYISPSGRRAICHHGEDADTHADIIDLNSHAVVARIEDAMPSGTTSWSRDESLIACSSRKWVRVIDAETGRVVRELSLPEATFALGSGFSPDNRLLAVGLAEYAGVVVFDCRTGATVFHRASDAWVYSAAFSPDGQTLAWSDAKGVHFFDAHSWHPLRFAPTSRLTPVEPGGLQFSHDGRHLAVACGLVVDIIDVASGATLTTLRGHAQRIHSIAFDDSSSRLVTTSIDRTVRVWEIPSGKPLTTLIGHESPTAAASFVRPSLGPPGEVVSVDVLNRVRTWSLGNNGPVVSARADNSASYISQLVFTPNGLGLRAASSTTLLTIDLTNADAPCISDVLPGGYRQVVPGMARELHVDKAGALTCHSIPDRSVVWTYDSPTGDVFASQDGRFAAVMRHTLDIAIVRAADGVELGRTAVEPDGYARPVFSPDGTVLATLAHRGTLRLYSSKDASLIAELSGSGERGSGIGWSPDGSLLAFSHARDGVTVINMHSRTPITTIERIGGDVWSIAISPDKARMAVGSQDRITHIYELPSGDELLQLRDHTGTVMSVMWSPDGRFLATGGYDKRVFVYDSQPRARRPR